MADLIMIGVIVLVLSSYCWGWSKMPNILDDWIQKDNKSKKD